MSGASEGQGPFSLAVVLPAWNEAHRFDPAPFLEFVDRAAETRLLFVDDGSTDGTSSLLQALVDQRPGRIDLLRLDRNAGKGEAVRLGLLAALDSGAAMVGYLDADLAAPLDTMLFLAAEVERDERLEMVLGSRVKLLGWRIKRSELRHYLGRAFATCASIALRLAVYDTQCGAKVLRAGGVVRSALAAPFMSRWLFDVELIARLRDAAGTESLREVPIPVWADERGSSLRLRDFVKAPWELWGIWRRYPGNGAGQ